MAETPANLNPCNPQYLSPQSINQSLHCATFICVLVVVIILTYIHPAHIHILFILYSRCTTTFVHVCAMAPMGSAFS